MQRSQDRVVNILSTTDKLEYRSTVRNGMFINVFQLKHNFILGPVGGGAPSGVQGQSPWSGARGLGGKAPEAESLPAFGRR